MPAQNPKNGGSGSHLYNLTAIAVLVLLAALGLAYLIDTAVKSAKVTTPSLTDTDFVQQTVAGRELAIPRSWFRTGEASTDNFSQQVDLKFVLNFPASPTSTPVAVTLLPLTRARASSALLDTVYVHQIEANAPEAIPGLVGKTLKAGNGYDGEIIWYDALAPKPFVAKCATAPDPSRQAHCVRTVHLASGLAAVISFDAAALYHWREFDGEIAQWLSQIGAL